ncbi:hypothetical protein [Oceanobacillus halophilus]|nr:hypothetical protein [Oceanobacillus halophilus]
MIRLKLPKEIGLVRFLDELDLFFMKKRDGKPNEWGPVNLQLNRI